MTYDYGSPAQAAPRLANQGMRLVARIIDGLLTFAVGFGLTYAWWGPSQDAVRESATSGDPFGYLTDSRYLTYQVISGVVSILILLAYEGTMLKMKGQTLGKMVAGVKVVTIAWGPLSWGQVIGRILVMMLPNYVTCGLWSLLDSLWCLWDKERQCLHDKPVKTMVVSTR